MKEVGLLVAFGAGLLSFLSPCVLPLIPGYLSFLSGYGLAEIRSGGGRGRVMARSLSFVLGFTIVFIALGLLFAGGGALLGGGTPRLGLGQGGIPLSRWITIGAGVVVTLLGLNLVFDLVKALSFEARVHPDRAPSGIPGSILFGMAFAAGWSPCIGPILASILLIAAREADLARSLSLLGAYSLGLALPFIAAGLFFDRVKPLLDFFRRRARGVRIASGLLLVALGLAMALGRLALLSSLASQAGFALKAALSSDPGTVRAVSAALWFALAVLAAALPLIRRRKAPRPAGLVFIVLCVMIGGAELAGLISVPGLVSEWLLFQGA